MNFSVIPNILIKWIVSASQAELKISEVGETKTNVTSYAGGERDRQPMGGVNLTH